MATPAMGVQERRHDLTTALKLAQARQKQNIIARGAF